MEDLLYLAVVYYYEEACSLAAWRSRATDALKPSPSPSQPQGPGQGPSVQGAGSAEAAASASDDSEGSPGAPGARKKRDTLMVPSP